MEVFCTSLPVRSLAHSALDFSLSLRFATLRSALLRSPAWPSSVASRLVEPSRGHPKLQVACLRVREFYEYESTSNRVEVPSSLQADRCRTRSWLHASRRSRPKHAHLLALVLIVSLLQIPVNIGQGVLLLLVRVDRTTWRPLNLFNRCSSRTSSSCSRCNNSTSSWCRQISRPSNSSCSRSASFKFTLHNLHLLNQWDLYSTNTTGSGCLRSSSRETSSSSWRTTRGARLRTAGMSRTGLNVLARTCPDTRSSCTTRYEMTRSRTGPTFERTCSHYCTRRSHELLETSSSKQSSTLEASQSTYTRIAWSARSTKRTRIMWIIRTFGQNFSSLSLLRDCPSRSTHVCSSRRCSRTTSARRRRVNCLQLRSWVFNLYSTHLRSCYLLRHQLRSTRFDHSTPVRTSTTLRTAITTRRVLRVDRYFVVSIVGAPVIEFRTVKYLQQKCSANTSLTTAASAVRHRHRIVEIGVILRTTAMWTSRTTIWWLRRLTASTGLKGKSTACLEQWPHYSIRDPTPTSWVADTSRRMWRLYMFSIALDAKWSRLMALHHRSSAPTRLKSSSTRHLCQSTSRSWRISSTTRCWAATSSKKPGVHQRKECGGQVQRRQRREHRTSQHPAGTSFDQRSQRRSSTPQHAACSSVPPPVPLALPRPTWRLARSEVLRILTLSTVLVLINLTVTGVIVSSLLVALAFVRGGSV